MVSRWCANGIEMTSARDTLTSTDPTVLVRASEPFIFTSHVLATSRVLLRCHAAIWARLGGSRHRSFRRAVTFKPGRIRCTITFKLGSRCRKFTFKPGVWSDVGHSCKLFSFDTLHKFMADAAPNTRPLHVLGAFWKHASDSVPPHDSARSQRMLYVLGGTICTKGVPEIARAPEAVFLGLGVGVDRVASANGAFKALQQLLCFLRDACAIKHKQLDRDHRQVGGSALHRGYSTFS